MYMQHLVEESELTAQRMAGSIANRNISIGTFLKILYEIQSVVLSRNKSRKFKKVFPHNLKTKTDVLGHIVESMQYTKYIFFSGLDNVEKTISIPSPKYNPHGGVRSEERSLKIIHDYLSKKKTKGSAHIKAVGLALETITGNENFLIQGKQRQIYRNRGLLI